MDIVGFPAVAVVGQEGEDGQIGLAGDGDDGGVALVVDIAFGVLENEPFGDQVREVRKVEAQRDDAVGRPVHVEAPHQRRAGDGPGGRTRMQHRGVRADVFDFRLARRAVRNVAGELRARSEAGVGRGRDRQAERRDLRAGEPGEYDESQQKRQNQPGGLSGAQKPGPAFTGWGVKDESGAAGHRLLSSRIGCGGCAACSARISRLILLHDRSFR